MEKTDLIKSAEQLQQVPLKYATEFGLKRDKLVEILNERMINRPDLFSLIGADNLDLMKDNHANHARFMESIFLHHSPEILVDTVLWVFRAYRSRNFASTYWAAQLNAWIEIYKKELTAECFSFIYPYYYWMQIHIPTFNHLAEKKLELLFSAH